MNLNWNFLICKYFLGFYFYFNFHFFSLIFSFFSIIMAFYLGLNPCYFLVNYLPQNFYSHYYRCPIYERTPSWLWIEWWGLYSLVILIHQVIRSTPQLPDRPIEFLLNQVKLSSKLLPLNDPQAIQSVPEFQELYYICIIDLYHFLLWKGVNNWIVPGSNSLNQRHQFKNKAIAKII